MNAQLLTSRDHNFPRYKIQTMVSHRWNAMTLSPFLFLFACSGSHYCMAFVPRRTVHSTNICHNKLLLAIETPSEMTKPVLIDNREDYIEIPFEGYFDGTKPESALILAKNNFFRQLPTIFTQIFETIGLVQKDELRPPFCLQLRLSNEAVYETERLRVESGNSVDAHPVAMTLYKAGCLLLDELFDERPIQRFWFLETIARIPYFSYTSMLHLYESLGWWRAVELRKVHSAEEWNELHHLLIMESLGGNSGWSDRFLAYHVAIAYYWLLNAVFLCSPRIAYQFMELLEAHAVDTYGTFVRENRKRLKELPPPAVARSYYTSGDLYLFDDFQVSRQAGSRRPPCENLLDVFENICQDEVEHVKTMHACQEYAMVGTRVVSPHLNYKESDMEMKRAKWKEWSEDLNVQLPAETEGYQEF